MALKEMKDVSISFRVSAKTHKDLKELARSIESSLSDICREAVEEELRQRRAAVMADPFESMM